MAPLIFASLLAGTILTSTEFAFIILACGPFWLGPVIFLKTWLIYTGLILAGLSFCHLILSFIPSLNHRLENPAKRFYLYLLVTWSFSLATLFTLVTSDLDKGSDPLTLLLTAGSYAVIVILILLKVPRTRFSIPSTSLLLSFVGVASAATVFWLSDRQFSSTVQDRSADYAGNAPHVCLIVLDAARGDHLSCYGYPFPTTPNIDRIAAQGLLCQNAYSASNWTPPGHISIFTGKYPSQHGNDGRPHMPGELVSMTEILNQKGYYCVAVYDNPLAGEEINLTQGFDRKFSLFRKTWAYPAAFRLWEKMIQRHTCSKATFALASKLFD